MAILFCGTRLEDFYCTGTVATTTDTAIIDTTFVGEGIQIPLWQSVNMGLPSSYTDLWFSWTEYTDGGLSTSTDGNKVSILGDTGHLILGQDGDNGNLGWALSTTGLNLIRNGLRPRDYAAGVRIRIDINLKFNDGGSGTVDMEVWQNGAKAASDSLTLSSHPSAGIQYLSFLTNDWGQFNVSDVIIADEDTRGLHIVPLDPDAAGTHSDWNNNYTAFGGLLAGEGIDTNTNGNRESWSVEAYPGPANPAGIHSVNVVANAYKAATGVQNLQGFLRVGGTDYDAASQSPDGGKSLCFTWENNPADSNPWQTTDLVTALEAGLEANT